MSGFALVARSLGRAGREWRLALLLWALELLLALAAIAPVVPFLSRALADRPLGDRFLERLDLVLLTDLLEENRSFVMALGPLLAAVTAGALLLNAFAAGGAIEALRFGSGRPVLLAFMRGGGRHFGRFLRMGLVAAPAAALAGAVLSAPLWIARGAAPKTAEGAAFWLGIAATLVAAFGALLVLLALDLARVRVAESGARRGVRTFRRTLFSLLRRPWEALALWLGLMAALVAAGAGLALLRGAISPRTGFLLLLLVVLQQAAVAARAFYRVALWAGEMRIVDRDGGRGSRIGA